MIVNFSRRYAKTRKEEIVLTVVGFAVTRWDQRVTGSAGTLVTAGRVRAQLVTVTPVLTLVQIDACPLICRIDGHSLVTIADTAFQ
jgi:hypothetical protein